MVFFPEILNKTSEHLGSIQTNEMAAREGNQVFMSQIYIVRLN